MVQCKTVEKITSYETIGDELKKWLNIIQVKWECKIFNVCPVKLHNYGNAEDDGFIIIYDDGFSDNHKIRCL
jgi:hypothetical protein